MLTYFVKRVREIRKFHVAVIQRRLRTYKKKKRDARAELLFCWYKPVTFFLSCLPSPSSLSSLLLWYRNFATMVTFRAYCHKWTSSSSEKMAQTVERYKYEKRLCDGRVSAKIDAFLSRLQERQKEKREFCAFFNSLRLAPDLCALDAWSLVAPIFSRKTRWGHLKQVFREPGCGRDWRLDDLWRHAEIYLIILIFLKLVTWLLWPGHVSHISAFLTSNN